MIRLKTMLIVVVLMATYFVKSFCQSDIETIKKLNRSWLDATVKGDSATLSTIFASDFTLINPGGIKMDRAACLSNMLVKSQQIVSVDIDSVTVRMLSGNVGLLAAWTSNVMISGAKKTIFKICYQDVYMKRNNKWQAVAAHVALLGDK